MSGLCRTITLLALLVLLSACQPQAMQRPDGFASYEKVSKAHKAISPERVVYRVRSHDNEGDASLDFWKTALRTHMRDSGYVTLEESDIMADGDQGFVLTLAAPFDARDYTYLIALFVHGDKLVVFESAGESSWFEKYREDIIKTIRNTRIGDAARL